MSNRPWPREPTVIGDKRCWAYVIRCNSCGKTDRITSEMSEELAQQKAPITFKRRGWQIGKNVANDYCFDCIGKFKAINKQRAERENTMASATVTPIKAEAPTPMGKQDRRAIFLKLEEVYVDENVGYSKGWDDEKVRVDLGVPRAWVEEVRELNFGPNKSEEVTKIFEEAKTLLSELTTLETQANNAKTALRMACEQLGKLEPRIRHIERQLDTIAKRVK